MTTDSIIPEADCAHDKREVPRAQFARQYCADHNLPHDYDSASRAEKTAILDAAERATGYHRKSLIRLFRRLRDLARDAVLGIVREVKKRGRPANYLPESAAVARQLAEKMGMSERKMVGAMPRWVPVVEKLARKVTERLRKPHLSDQVVQDLQSVSSATLGRFIRKDQPQRPRSPRKQRARSRHQRATPLRTWSDWKDLHPGEMQVDSVAHAGGRGGGGHLWTVTVIDVYSEWVDAEAIDGLTQEQVAEALDRMMARTPFAWRSVHTDNGGEFLNDVVIAWCDRNGLTRTRGRPGKSNDQAYVENANKIFVRALVGDQRYTGQKARGTLNATYAVGRSLANFFEARQHLVEKVRNGRRTTRRYGRAQIPDVRLVDSADRIIRSVTEIPVRASEPCYRTGGQRRRTRHKSTAAPRFTRTTSSHGGASHVRTAGIKAWWPATRNCEPQVEGLQHPAQRLEARLVITNYHAFKLRGTA